MALGLLASHGMEGLTISGLAKALDYTPGALYRYFDSKDALFAALQRRSIAHIRAQLALADADVASLAEAHALEPRARALLTLAAVAQVYVHMLDDAPEQLKLIGYLLADPRNLVGQDGVVANAPVLVGVLGEVAQRFAAAAECGALSPGDTGQRTVIFWSSLQGVVQLEKMTRFDPRMFDPRALGAQTAHALLVGWGADAATVSTAQALLTKRPQ